METTITHFGKMPILLNEISMPSKSYINMIKQIWSIKIE